MRNRSLLLPLAAIACVVMLVGCGNSTDLTNTTDALDGTPPPAPEGLVAVDAVDRNELIWAPSAAADVASYQVFQYQPDPSRENAYVMVAEVSSPTYMLPGNVETEGFYRVRAIDTSGNHSPMSSQYHAEFGIVPNGGGGNDAPVDDGDRRIRGEL